MKGVVATALLLLLASLPLAGLVWVRWRFRPARMQREAQKRLARAEAAMQRRSDGELSQFLRGHPYLNGIVAGSAPARELLALVERNDFVGLVEAWHRLWPALVDAEREAGGGGGSELLDHTIELNAAITVLARRHPTG
jgi:hypothetical protein